MRGGEGVTEGPNVSALTVFFGDREHTMATVLSTGVSVWEDSSVVENLPSKCKAPGISSSAHQTPK